MNRIARLGVLLALLVTCSSAVGTASAQEATPTWRVATGRTQKSDGTWIAPKPFTPEARRELIQAIVQELAQAEVSRDWQPAAKKLEAWNAMLTWSGIPDRESLLEHIALRKVELYERFGRTREALAAVEGVLVQADVLLPVGETTAPATWGVLDGIELKDATAEDLALQTRVLATPYVTANRERLRKLAQEPADDDGVARIVSSAVRAGDRGQVHELGKRAIPTLRRIAAESAGTWMPETIDPVSILVGLDERAAADVILEHFDAGGTFWRRRAIRAMRASLVLRNPGTWSHEADDPATAPKLLEPWWSNVVLRLLGEPDSAVDALPFVADLARGDALGEALVARVLGLLAGRNPEVVSAVQSALNDAMGRQTTRRILETMLTSTDSGQREYASAQLIPYAHCPALKAQIDSPDAAVRLAVVRALGWRSTYRELYLYDGNGAPMPALRERKDQPEMPPDDVAALERGLRDPDVGVRREAAEIAAARQVPLAADTWIALARDRDATIRAMAASSLWRADATTAARALEILALDTEPEVLAGVDRALVNAPQDSLETLVPAVRARSANARATFLGTVSEAADLFRRRLASTSAGAELLGEWAVAGDDAAGVGVLEHLRQKLQAARRNGSRVRGVVDRAAAGIPFDDQRLARLVAATSRFGRSVETMKELPSLRIVDPAPWRALALDATQPLWMRIHAFALVAADADDALVAAIVEALRSDATPTDDAVQQGLGFVFEALPAERAAAVLRGVLHANPIPVHAGAVATRYVGVHALDSASADTVLSLWIDDRQPFWSWEAQNAALREVASRPFAQQGDRLVKAVHSRAFSRTAVQLLGDLREPRYRALLVECLDASWMTEMQEREALQLAAIVAIGRYLDDEAVEILLDAAGRMSRDDLRKACYEALERIRVHREQRAAWEQRKRAGATKDAAIDELVKVLESADANLRAQAVRSLATLGAVEELPRILQMLKDKDAGVREAAQRALEVLNASTAAPR